MGALGAFLDSQPFIALFLVIGLGYAVGRISIAGFSLGIGACLFVGLAVGAIAPKSAPPGLLGLVGLILFLYGIGIQYGKHFFRGLASPYGIKANLLAAVAVLAGFGAAILTARWLGFSNVFGAGMFAGSMTSTASLQASIEAAGNRDPAVGYAIAYPFGVFGPILFFYLTRLLFRPKIEVPPPQRLVTGEIRAGDRGLAGQTVGEVLKKAPAGAELLMIRRGGVNLLPDPAMTLEADDVLAVAGFADALRDLEVESSETARADRRNLDYVRVFVSKAGFVGKQLGSLPIPQGVSAEIIQIRRGDVDLIPKPDLIIEHGDQLGVLIEPGKREAVSRFFGDSINAETQFCFVSLGLGLVVGGLVGLIPIPIPGVGSVTLGVAGGSLVMALVLGYFGRLGPFNWNMPVVANVIMRNFGLTVFLAGVGMSSGAPFAQNIAGAGLSLFVAGVITVAVVVLTVMFVGYYILKMNFDDLLGIASGATGNPAILAYGNQLAPTGKPDIGYAMIFPGVGTILKIILVQIMVVLAAGGAPPG